jgi:hypothetical protein
MGNVPVAVRDVCFVHFAGCVRVFGMTVPLMPGASLARSVMVHMIKWRDEGYDEIHEKKRKKRMPRQEPEEATHP